MTFNSSVNRAIVETNAMIIGENVKLNLGMVTHNRFYDMAEKRDGVWKLFRRQSIYDMGSFTFPLGVVDIDQSAVAKYPREYAALAYLLEKADFRSRVYSQRAAVRSNSR